MINVSSPRHSFVQFYSDGQSELDVFSCNPLLVNFHLPVIKEDDIAFQVKLTGTKSELDSLAYGFGLVYAGNFYSLPNAHVLRTDETTVYLTHMAGFGNAFNNIPAGKCFRIQFTIAPDQVFLSNVLERIVNDCYTSAITYFADRSSFGFAYCGIQAPITEYQDAKPPTGVRRRAVATSSYQWGVRGARVYKPGYPANGFGEFWPALTTPHFWVNGNFAEDVFTGTNGSNLVDGRMNKNAIWAEDMAGTEPYSPYNEFVGFTGKINLTEDKTLWVAFGVDDAFKFRLNGVEKLNTEGGGVPFHQWSVFPVDFRKGENNFEASVKNINLEGYNPAGFAMEIYDMTLQQLLAATKESDLKILFRTADMVGQYFDLGTTIAYSCENPAYTLVNENGVYRCKKISYAEPVELFNKVRLPFYFTRPQYTTNEEIYTTTSGLRKVISADVAKEWQVLTDYMPDAIHEKLQIALRHESTYIESSKFESFFRINGNYEIEWPEILDYPLGTAKFKGFEEDFYEKTDSCGVCAPYVAPPPPPPLECPTLLYLTKTDEGNHEDSIGWKYSFTLGLPSNPPENFSWELWRLPRDTDGNLLQTGTITPAVDGNILHVTVPYSSELGIYFTGNCANGTQAGSYGMQFNSEAPVENCQFDAQWQVTQPVQVQAGWRVTATINYNGETPPELGWNWQLTNETERLVVNANRTTATSITFDFQGDNNDMSILFTAVCAGEVLGTQLQYSFKSPATPSTNTDGKSLIVSNNTTAEITVQGYQNFDVVIPAGQTRRVAVEPGQKFLLKAANGTKTIALYNNPNDPPTFNAFISVGQTFNFETDMNANPWGINNVNLIVISDPN